MAGLDVHLNKVGVWVLRSSPEGTAKRLFGNSADSGASRHEVPKWMPGFAPQAVSTKSTGIYWISPYRARERVGIRAKVVNAQHVAKVEGRKAASCDARWLATLARAGLLRARFIPDCSVRHVRQLATRMAGLAFCGAARLRLFRLSFPASYATNIRFLAYRISRAVPNAVKLSTRKMLPIRNPH